MKKHRIIRRFLISYLLLLIIPIISSVIIYMSTANMVKADTMQANRQFLEDSIEILDKELINIDYTIHRLIMNNDVNTFLNTAALQTGSPEFFRVMRASYVVHSYTINTDFIKDLLVYSRTNDIIITTERVHTEIENDYGTYFRFGDLSYNQWKDEILNTYRHYSFLPATNVSFSGNVFEVIPFIQSVPFFSRKHLKGNIVGFIDVEELGSLLNRLNRKNIGSVFLFDSSDKLLAKFGNTELKTDPLTLLSGGKTSIGNLNLENKKWLISQATSKIAGFKILSILPSSYIDSKVSYIERIIFSITLLLLFLGILFALYLSYRNSKPVLELTDIARKQLDNINFKGSDLDIIKSGLTKLIRTNKELSQYKKTQIPLSRNSFLERILHEKPGYFRNIEAMLKYNEIELGDPPYNVVLLNIGGYGSHINDDILAEKDLIRIIIIDAVKKLFPENGYFLNIDTENIAWIYQEEEKEAVKKQLIVLNTILKRENTMDILISRGRPQDTIREICTSYRQASQGMEYMLTIDKGNPICNFDELPERSDSFYYTVDLESRLILFIKTGQTYEITSILDEIFQENFKNRDLSVIMMNQLLKSLLNTLFRINEFFLEKNKDPIDLNSISTISSAIDKFSELRRLFTNLSNKTADLNDSGLKNLKDKIFDFIDENYSNPGLNLDILADKFGYKESYLYHFFQDTIGQSFASYLESIRMAKACDFLKESNFTIDMIAEQTGYGSSHSFRRAFKRRFDLSPSLYKKCSLNS